MPPFRLPLITDQVAIVDLRSNTKVGEISGSVDSRLSATCRTAILSSLPNKNNTYSRSLIQAIRGNLAQARTPSRLRRRSLCPARDYAAKPRCITREWRFRGAEHPPERPPKGRALHRADRGTPPLTNPMITPPNVIPSTQRRLSTGREARPRPRSLAAPQSLAQHHQEAVGERPAAPAAASPPHSAKR